ncbi:hypothetical protein BST83_11750 [Polaribacter filamentus]|uniref:Tyr recombinase domain-containing protein n=1 Tax=Polaribacter filamentus TaxID=53483 RepID=A0A2S7KYQ9_9FLAO|nr:hypothetical protein BST83_11750 [Polaribacter filamentus]
MLYKKNLTFHLARHTFSIIVTLTNGVSTETVSQLLGHSRISTTQIYAKVIERKLTEDLITIILFYGFEVVAISEEQFIESLQKLSKKTKLFRN